MIFMCSSADGYYVATIDVINVVICVIDLVYYHFVMTSISFTQVL